MEEDPQGLEFDLAGLEAELEQLTPQELHEAMLAIVVDARTSTSAASADNRELLKDIKAGLSDEEMEQICERAGIAFIPPKRRT